MRDFDANLLFAPIVDHFDAGVFVVDRQYRIVLWNAFMSRHTGKSASDVIGKSLFDMFPELAQKWLERKINSVAVLKNYAFTSWEHRPWLFQFAHHRPITGDMDYMRQNCVFMPIKNSQSDEVDFISVTIFDATDTAIYQRQLSQVLEKLEQSNMTDSLTKIYNRRHLSECLAVEFSRAQRHHGGLALIMFDLDHFKKINDTYGHLGGDEVLKAVAPRVKKLLRTPDIFGRYGGEEFCLLLPDTDLAGGIAVAERIRGALAAEPVIFGGQKIAMSASFGVTVFVPGLLNHEVMIELADEALYLCKGSGRNCVKSKVAPLSGAIFST